MIGGMKNVLMVGLTPPLEGGSERHIFEVSSRLKNTVLTQKDSLCENKIEVNIAKGKYLKSLMFFFSVFLRIPRLFLSKFEILHIHESYLILLLPILKLKFKTVVTVHGIIGFRYYENNNLGRKLICNLCIIKYSINVINPPLQAKLGK